MNEDFETGVNNPAAEDDDYEGREHVPVSVVKAIREELKAIKGQSADDRAERDRLTQELAVYRAQIQAHYAQQAPKEEDPFDGLEDDDVLTVAQLKAIAPKLAPKKDPLEIESQVRAQNPDYDAVIKEFLPKLLMTKPHLKREIESARNPYQLAYDLASGTPEYVKNRLQGDHKERLDKAEQNSKKPGSLSQVGQTNKTRSAEFYDTLTDDDLEKRIAKVKRRQK